MKSQLPATIIGLVLIVTVVTLLVVVPCPSSATFFAERILLALGVGCLGYLVTGSITYEGSIAGTGPVLKATGPVVFFVLIYIVNPPALLGANGDCNNVIDINGKVLIDEKPLPDVNVNVLELEQQRITNMFGVFPAFHVEKNKHVATLTFSIQYKQTDPALKNIDTSIVFTTDSILGKQVEIRLHSSMPSKMIAGHVTDDNGNPLSNARVSAEDKSAVTDEGGYFSLKVQTSETSTPVKFEKENYQTRTLPFNIPNPDISITLEKIKSP